MFELSTLKYKYIRDNDTIVETAVDSEMFVNLLIKVATVVIVANHNTKAGTQVRERQ